jgi:hypothetical protein
VKRSFRFRVGQRVQFDGDDRAKVIDVSSKGDWVQVVHTRADGVHAATKLSKAEARRLVMVNPRVTTR